VLRQYHETLGQLIFRFDGTVERLAGEALTVIFNDPLPCADPVPRAVQLAVAARERMHELSAEWRKRGDDLGFGIGIDSGYATLGNVGFEGRLDYSAIGTVVNIATRLCDQAEDGQILITQRVQAATEQIVDAATVGELKLQGFVKPVPAFNVRHVRTSAEPSAPAAAEAGPTPDAPARHPLTSREWQVAVLIAGGHTNRQIAEKLVLSERTADRHVENIREKLGVSSRTQIAAWAAEHRPAAT
jgi:DNA-binding CsgD family transcriptional regulator